MHIRSAVVTLTFVAPLLAPLGSSPFSPRLAWSQPTAGQPGTGAELSRDAAAAKLKDPKFSDRVIEGQKPDIAFILYAGRAEAHWYLHHLKAAQEDATKALDLAAKLPATTLNYNQSRFQAYRARGMAVVEANEDLAKALPDLEAALKIEPRDLTVIGARIVVKYNLDDASYKGDLETSLKLNPRSAILLTARGLTRKQGAFMTEVELRAAVRDFDAAIAADPTYAPAYFERYRVYDSDLFTNEVDNAARPQRRADLDRAIALDTYDPRFYEARAHLIAAEQPDQAEADYTRLIALDPKNAESYLKRANFQLERLRPTAANLEQAQKDFGQAYYYALMAKDLSLLEDSDYNSVNARQLIGLGKVYLKQNKAVDAIKAFNEAYETGSSSYKVEALGWRGRVLVRGNRAQQVVSEITEAMADVRENNRQIPIPGQLTSVLGARGMAFVRLRQFEDGVVDLSAALKDQYGISQDAELYYNRAVAYAGLKQNDKALADFNIAAYLDPKYATQLQKTPFGPRLTPKAPDKNALVDTSNTPSAHKLLGNEWRASGNNTKALAEYSKAIELDANYADAYNNRGGLLSEAGKTAQALADFNKAIALKPGDGRFLYGRGIVLVGDGKMTEGMADLQKAVALLPRDGLIMSGLGFAQQKMGQFAEAEASYNQQLQLASDSEAKLDAQTRLIIVRATQDKAPTPEELALIVNTGLTENKRNQAACAAQLKATPNVPALVALNKALLAEVNKERLVK